MAGLSSGVRVLATGGENGCVVLGVGTVKCWGWNQNGEIGDGTTLRRAVPVDTIGLSSGVTAITAGETHACALIADGSIRCWGENINGQIGDGTAEIFITPSVVVGFP